jgi:putative membrane protein insertion efficiency factor
VEKIINLIIQLSLKTYQYFISPLFGNCCRFSPSCSYYTADAIKLHGFFAGCFLSLKRILRCHPWSQGGIDLVPEKISNAN